MRAIELLREHSWGKAVVRNGYLKGLIKQSGLRCKRCNLELIIYFWESGFRSWWCFTDHSKRISPMEEISKEYSCKYQVMKKALKESVKMRVIEALREHSWKRAGYHPRRRAGYRHSLHSSRWTRQLHQGLSPIIGSQVPIVEKATRLICTRCNLVLEIIFWSNDLISWNCFNDSEDYIGAEINSQHFLNSKDIITDIYGEQICINCRIRAIKQALG